MKNKAGLKNKDSEAEKRQLILTAHGLKKADHVLKNGKILNVFTGQLIEGDIALSGRRIAGIGSYEGEAETDLNGKTVVPGLIDAHFHIESSMTVPSSLSPVLLQHGVCTVIADPHEIVNAAGTDGLDFMLEDAGKAETDYFFMVPSSVPSCDFEVNGAGHFSADQMVPYSERSDVLGLAEVMRMSDVLEAKPAMMDKLSLFSCQMTDGHAPGLAGKDLQAYRAAGIRNDHEAASCSEAIERLQNGFQLLIREGSGAKNLQDILPGLLKSNMPLNRCSFCTDDKHIEDIMTEGTIDYEIREALKLGCSPADAIRMATINTAEHYGLKDRGAIAPGFLADLVIVDDLDRFQIDSVWKNGKPVCTESENHKQIQIPEPLRSTVHLPDLSAENMKFSGHVLNGIEMIPEQLYTRPIQIRTDQDIFPSSGYNLLLAAERYGKTGEYAWCPLSGYGLKNGAIAMSYAHDSHNAIAASDSIKDLLLALETLQKIQGGIVLVENGKVFEALPMEAAGLMSSEPAETVAEKVSRMKKKAKEMGVKEGIDPFANLSFLSLPVIPEVRLCPQGLFDVTNQTFFEGQKGRTQASES